MGTGDDVLALLKALLERMEWQKWKQYDRVEEKPIERSGRGEFASYVVSQGRIFRNPVKLWRKLDIANQRGKLSDMVHGYFLEWMTIYCLRDELINLLTEEEMMYHVRLTRFLFNVRKESGVNASFVYDKMVGVDILEPCLTPYMEIAAQPWMMEELTVPMTTKQYYLDTEDS
jgi:hypothetical protein